MSSTDSAGDPGRTDANPATDPGRALDDLEERQLDDDLRPASREDEQDEYDEVGSAFEVDLEPEDQGRADAGSEPSS